MNPPRVKVTFPPPAVCSNCYWEARFKELVRLNHLLREEMIKMAANRAHSPSSNNEAAMEMMLRGCDDGHAELDPEARDVVSHFERASEASDGGIRTVFYRDRKGRLK